MASSASELPDLSLDQLIELERRAAERDAGGGTPVDGGGDDDGDDDDAIVLSWWQHPLNVVTMVVAAALLAGMLGWLIGDARAQPQYGATDVGFLQDMRIHHEQAVYMGFVFRELEGTDLGMQIVAGSIVQTQSLEIGRMVQLLREFGEPEAGDLQAPRMNWMGMSVEADQMPGLATEAELTELAGSSGAEADRLFADLMIAHHEAGIHMAEYAADHAENDEVVALATSMAQAQRGEIHEIEQQFDDAG